MKKAWLLFYILYFLISLPAQSQQSAVRRPEETWQQALDRNTALDFESEVDTLAAIVPSARGAAQSFSEALDASFLPEWPGSFQELQLAFQKARDIRLYVQSNQKSFPRRSTWFYPRDGCYARAAHVARVFENDGKVRPGKVFAFGNLKMRTFFKPQKYVYWSYHVAAAFRWRGEIFILDPGVEPQRLLRLSEWLGRFSKLSSVKVALCDSFSYTPGSRCWGGTSRQERFSVQHQLGFLPVEWNYVLNLRLNPLNIFGEQPPWGEPIVPVRPIREAEGWN